MVSMYCSLLLIGVEAEVVLVDQPAVGGRDDALAGLEPVENLDEIIVTAAELDGPARRARALDHEHPVSAGIVEEGAVGDQNGTAGIAQGELGRHGLAALH